jgi:hypothetical protein
MIPNRRNTSRFDILEESPAIDNLNLIFIHIPKTGGTSIRRSLLGERRITHRTALAYKRYDEDYFNGAYKFSVIRNPLDRIVSTYFYNIRRGKQGRDCVEIVSHSSCFEDFCENLYETFNEQINPGFFPQMWWLTDEFHRVIVDDIFLFDFIEESMRAMSDRFGITKELNHTNKSNHAPFMEYHTKRTIEIVNDLYAFDTAIYNKLMGGE